MCRGPPLHAVHGSMKGRRVKEPTLWVGASRWRVLLGDLPDEVARDSRIVEV
jgi:hypothetical protein